VHWFGGSNHALAKTDQELAEQHAGGYSSTRGRVAEILSVSVGGKKRKEPKMQVTPEMIAAGTALAGGVLGYAYREYRNRMRPFLQVIKTDGSTTKSDEIVPVQPEVSASLEGSFYIKKPKDQPPLRDIREHWDKADDMKRLWPLTKPDVEAILAAPAPEPMCEALKEAFDGRLFDHTLRILLVNNRLSIPAAPAGKPEVVRVFDDQKDDCVWLDFPTKAVTFGKGMTHPAVRARCEPLLGLIRCLAIEQLHGVFRQYKGVKSRKWCNFAEAPLSG
jgi:hypothetical protein